MIARHHARKSGNFSGKIYGSIESVRQDTGTSAAAPPWHGLSRHWSHGFFPVEPDRDLRFPLNEAAVEVVAIPWGCSVGESPLPFPVPVQACCLLS